MIERRLRRLATPRRRGACRHRAATAPRWRSALVLVALATACAGASSPPPALLDVALEAGPLPLAAGATHQLTLTATWSDGTSGPLSTGVTWQSDAPAVASVGDGGLVTALAPGRATISASATVGATTRTAAVEVEVPDPQGYDPGPGWVLAWSDEFDGTAVDPASWTFDLGSGGWGNAESEYYRAENATVAGGFLTITAREEPFGDALYTSARLQTSRLHAFTYGTIAMRARLPFGQGMWPAFWLLGADSASWGLYGGDVAWPGCGELDVMEMIGGLADGSGDFTTHGTLHYLDASGRNPAPSFARRLPARLADAFHVYEVVWTPHSITWKVDGLAFGTKVLGPDMEEFGRPMFLLLNLAVGGAWGGWVDASTTFPQTFVVDWVRVYQDPAAAPGGAPGLPVAWHLSSAPAAGVTPSAETLDAARGTTSGFQPLKVLSAPARWLGPAMTGAYEAGAWTVSAFTTSPGGASVVRAELFRTAADGSAPVSLGAATVDVSTTGGGNHVSAFTIPGVPALTFAGERLLLELGPVSGIAATLIYNGNDFDSVVTTPWSPPAP